MTLHAETPPWDSPSARVASSPAPSSSPMRVLTVTNMWPTAEAPQFGVFVKRQVEALREAGLDVDVLFVNGRASTLNYLRGFRDLRRRVRERPYDLIHATYVFSGVIARAQWRHPVVVTFTGFEVLDTWQAPLSRLLSRVVDAVVIRSEQMKRRLQLPDAAVIPAGVDLDLFRPLPKAEARRRLGLPLDAKIVLFVGEPRPEKRVDVIERATQLLRARDPHVQLIKICGKTQDQVALYLNAADVLALASEHEGSPGAVKEAMACNLPVVATDVGDVARWIDGVEGCYLCRRTPEDFAEKIQLVLERGRRTDGRERVKSLSWPDVTQRLLEVFERAAQARS